jgi:hypothetical protein
MKINWFLSTQLSGGRIAGPPGGDRHKRIYEVLHLVRCRLGASCWIPNMGTFDKSSFLYRLVQRAHTNLLDSPNDPRRP